MYSIISVGVVAILLSALSSLGSAVKTDAQVTSVPPPTIPMLYKIPCGNKASGYTGPICDGRSQYCENTSRVFCGSCTRICQPGQSIYQCQRACKMYLDINAKAERDQALENSINAHVDKKLESMDIRREKEREKLKDDMDKMTSQNLGLMIALIVFAIVFILVVLPTLVYIVKTVRHVPNYRPVFQPEPVVKPNEDMAESGIQTGPNTTPASARRIDVENQARDGISRPIGGNWNIVTNPSDAAHPPGVAQPTDTAVEVQALP